MFLLCLVELSYCVLERERERARERYLRLLQWPKVVQMFGWRIKGLSGFIILSSSVKAKLILSTFLLETHDISVKYTSPYAASISSKTWQNSKMPLAQQKSHSSTLPPAVCWWINLSSPLQSSSVSLKAPCLLSFSGRLAWRTSALLLENSSLKWRGCTVALVCHPKLVANTNSNVPAGCWVFGEFTGVTGSEQLCNAKSWSRNVKI